MAEYTGQPIYNCRNCQNPIAQRDDLLSKKFKARTGPAYLFSHAMNAIVGRKEDKQLMTGHFTIADIYCSNCGEVLGWKYVRAYDPIQSIKKESSLLRLLRLPSCTRNGGRWSAQIHNYFLNLVKGCQLKNLLSR